MRAPTPIPPLPAAGGPVTSPCVNICQMDEATGLCRGCRRSLDEIAVWSQLGDAARLAIWRQLALRPPPRPLPLPDAAA